MEAAPRHQAHQRAFQFAHIGAHVTCDKQRHVHRKMRVFQLRLALQDRDLCFQIRRLDVDHQTPLKARAQTIFETVQLLGRTIARDDDLLAVFVQRVEGVEELFLRALFTGKELNVIDQQHIRGAETVAKTGDAIVSHTVDHLVRERFTGDIGDGSMRHAVLHTMPYGMHQMRFAETNATVHEQRVIHAGGSLGNGLRRRTRELIARTAHKRVELIPRV